jgi:hypothetical protein
MVGKETTNLMEALVETSSEENEGQIDLHFPRKGFQLLTTIHPKETNLSSPKRLN